ADRFRFASDRGFQRRIGGGADRHWTADGLRAALHVAVTNKRRADHSLATVGFINDHYSLWFGNGASSDSYCWIFVDLKLLNNKKGATMRLKQTPGKLGLALLVCLVFGGCASTAAAQSQASATSSTLYKRLGGYDAIAAV